MGMFRKLVIIFMVITSVNVLVNTLISKDNLKLVRSLEERVANLEESLLCVTQGR